jgi:hypothetical protein
MNESEVPSSGLFAFGTSNEQGSERLLERRLELLETAVSDATKSVQVAKSAIVKLKKECSAGDLYAIEKQLSLIEEMSDSLGQVGPQLRKAWGWASDDIDQYVSGPLLDEVRRACEEGGLAMHQALGSNWVGGRKLEVSKTVRLGKIALKGHVASSLAKQVNDHLSKGASRKPEAFAEMLAKILREFGTTSKQIELRTIYNLITALPGVSKEYDEATFVSEVNLLGEAMDENGFTVRSGERLYYPGAGRAVGSGKAIQMVDDEGRVRAYAYVELKPKETRNQTEFFNG